MTEPVRQRVVLAGMMGAGKTTTARALAARLGWQMRDCDDDLQTRTGRTAAEIASQDGVARLHQLEEAVLLAAIQGEEHTVITAAGSVVASAKARAALPRHTLVVWLDAPVPELLRRMDSDGHRRPLDRDAAERLAATREPYLEELADLRLDARRSTQELVGLIVAALEGWRSLPRGSLTENAEPS